MRVEVSELQPFRVTMSVYQPVCIATQVCVVAPAMAVPLKYHWLPAGALLCSVSPEEVMTGADGTGLTVTLKSGETVPLPQELVHYRGRSHHIEAGTCDGNRS